MSSVIYTNMASLVAQKNLLGAQSALATSVERLSSGLRINRARDDAAGLSIATSLQSQINGANQGIRNLNDAISLVQTAEGAIAAATDMGQRILTLATQGANGTLSATEDTAILNEMKKLLDSIESIGGRTSFAGNPLLDKSTASSVPATGEAFNMQVSNSASDVVILTNDAFRDIGIGTGTVAVGTTFADGQASALATAVYASSTSWSAIQIAAKGYVEALSSQRSLLGAYQNRMEYTLANITELSANLSASRSRVIDTDYAAETAALTRGQILQQAATAMLAQANQMPNVILTLLK